MIGRDKYLDPKGNWWVPLCFTFVQSPSTCVFETSRAKYNVLTVMEYQLYIFIIKVGQADNEMDNV
jgi:hypothetical protein